MRIYSDQALHDPLDYYGGYKAARLTSIGVAARSLSHPYAGHHQGSQFQYSLSDVDVELRRELHSPTDRFWVNKPFMVSMTNRDNRRVRGRAWTVFVGRLVDAQPADPLGFDITLLDLMSAGRGPLRDDMRQPWRKVSEGMLHLLDNVSEHFDYDTPEPIIYGHHVRVPDVDPASGEGFEITPTLLGLRTVGGTQYWVWLIAGHACTNGVHGIRLDQIPQIEGANWLIPGHANYLGAFGAPYEDLVSSTYGNLRRYTLLYGRFGEEGPDAAALGDAELTVAVTGIETNGDGSGTAILDRFQQYKHFVTNYVARTGRDSYQRGPWLTVPSWDLLDDGVVPMVDTASFDACSAIAIERFPPVGYLGAAVIGARAGEQSPVLRWISDWNRSCGCQFGITHLGQMRVTLLHPTEAIKAAAPLYTDATEILESSFGTQLGWKDQCNVLPFRTDYEHRSGIWKTNETHIEFDSRTNYGELLGDLLELPFAVGITQANHIAVLQGRQRAHPPKMVQLKATVGPHHRTRDSLAYREIGDYIRYRHVFAVGGQSQIRLAQVQTNAVDVGNRTVMVEALDCEDLIGFDTFEGAT